MSKNTHQTTFTTASDCLHATAVSSSKHHHSFHTRHMSGELAASPCCHSPVFLYKFTSINVPTSVLIMGKLRTRPRTFCTNEGIFSMEMLNRAFTLKIPNWRCAHTVFILSVKDSSSMETESFITS